MGKALTDDDIGRRVTYVPGHVDGDAGHPDCETGTLMHWNNAGAMVDYGRNKCRTNFTDLIWG